MGIYSDRLDDLEECIKLISYNNANKSVLSLILIDSLADIYSHAHVAYKEAENNHLLQQYKQIERFNPSRDNQDKIDELLLRRQTGRQCVERKLLLHPQERNRTLEILSDPRIRPPSHLRIQLHYNSNCHSTKAAYRAGLMG